MIHIKGGHQTAAHATPSGEWVGTPSLNLSV